MFAALFPEIGDGGKHVQTYTSDPPPTAPPVYSPVPMYPPQPMQLYTPQSHPPPPMYSGGAVRPGPMHQYTTDYQAVVPPSYQPVPKRPRQVYEDSPDTTDEDTDDDTTPEGIMPIGGDRTTRSPPKKISFIPQDCFDSNDWVC